MNKNYFQPIEKIIKKAIYSIYKKKIIKLDFQYPKNNDFGDISLVLFSLSNTLNKPIKEIGENIGNYVNNEFNNDVKFSILKGFLNFIFKDNYYLSLLREMSNSNFFYNIKKNFFLKKKKIIIEYSSPNANKPLHLGHLRNILIGSSMSKILKMIGHDVIQVQIINDRGIHVCKSIIAWKKFGNGITPIKQNIKGDHFVGKYYSFFEKIYNEELNKYKNKETPILKCARILLKKWENGDKKTIDIWKKMNNWVYDGFKETYDKLGINFDITEYESNIYNIGKEIIKEGLKKGIFFKKKDGSVWIDFNKKGYDPKLLLRSDKTSVYITQDIGNAIKRLKEFNIDRMIYVVGKEQENHFKILFRILKSLGYLWVNKLFHFSYEMVFLPTGRMQSRVGNVINIDYIISKMISIAKKNFNKKRLIKNYKKDDIISYEKIGLSALKYFFLKMDPKKKIIFDPLKSINFKGNTGVYIQYTYSRIRSLERNFLKSCYLINNCWNNIIFDLYEKNIIKIINKYPFVLIKSSNNFDPSLLANYIYEISRTFNRLYQKKKLIDCKNIIYSNIYINIIHITGNIIKSGMNLLGIDMIDIM
ncbi:arginine--tRNA ligase [Blattabacterium cuenoti]|uniref:arginine--tRNA ligase n=1 Tax=Blattabacterium cuenoti TaxID=1653831 RepID=UPI00163CD20A|nr:arginine--tRNA ligase [Blattabacterium cuenoti]